jgi:hypothetical protein
VKDVSRPEAGDPVCLRHRPRERALENLAVPGVRARLAPEVQVDELVQQGLEHVAGADPRIRGDREPPLARDGEAEAVGAGAAAPNLELRRRERQRPAGERGQGAKAMQLPAQVDAGDQVIGGMAARLGDGHRRNIGGRSAADSCV